VVSGEESARILSVSDITVSFGGITALDGVSLGVSSGEVLGIIGPNGACKTTLFNVICGFVTPAAGTITWRGGHLAGIRPEKLASLGIARTLQGVGLFAHLSALENVITGAQRFRRAGFAGSLLGLPWSDRDERALRDRALAALRTVDCADAARRLPGTLPYAVQKRVALARALVAEPDLLLLDEPAGGLDAAELSALKQTIAQLGSSIAVLLVDHHMDLVTSVCNRVVVLDFGRVIAEGAPDAVRRDPAVLEAYLGRDADTAATATAGSPADAHR
jgi:branched-chain amino acid transport system ATP-binding protein